MKKVLALVLFALALPVFAQSSGKPSPAAYDMQQMWLNGQHEGAGFKPSADIDRDFAMMLRHSHKISIRIAEHEVQHGKDPQAKEIARRIAEAHKKEAAELDAWLKARAAQK